MFTAEQPPSHEQFRLPNQDLRSLHAVTCKLPKFVQPVCTACRLPFYAFSQVDGQSLSTTPR